MTFKVILNLMKNLRLHNVDILKKFIKDKELNKKYISEKDEFFYFKISNECTRRKLKSCSFRDLLRDAEELTFLIKDLPFNFQKNAKNPPNFLELIRQLSTFSQL